MQTTLKTKTPTAHASGQASTIPSLYEYQKPGAVQATPSGQIQASSGTALSELSGSSGYIQASRQVSGDGGNTELYTNFTAQAEKEAKITTNVTNLSQQPITVILQQQNAGNEWVELGRQTVYQAAELVFEKATISSNPLQRSAA